MSASNAPSRITLVVAMDEGGLIGRQGTLPWRMPEDLKHFRKTTMGHPILMGRRTFESLRRPLDGRDNLVLSRDADFEVPAGVRRFGSLDEALAAAAGRELMGIGGAELYRQLLPRADRLVLTRVHARLPGDTFFPDWDSAAFERVSTEPRPADGRHPYPYTFEDWVRKG